MGKGTRPMGTFYTRSELVRARATWRAAGKTVVLTNGCYDLLHPGHVRLLEQARSLGGLLILALNTDASVARLKGPSRPLIPEDERARMALALEAVDAVTFFDEDTPRELIAEVLPDILIKERGLVAFRGRPRRGGGGRRQGDTVVPGSRILHHQHREGTARAAAGPDLVTHP